MFDWGIVYITLVGIAGILICGVCYWRGWDAGYRACLHKFSLHREAK